MQHDPAKVAECRGWLDRAWADLDSAEILLGSARPRQDTAVYHCQQAAEKAWKAFLFWHEVPFRKTHNLHELGQAAWAVDGSLALLAERAEELTPFAWLFRYPGDIEPLAQEEADAALALAREVYVAVLARLPEEARP